MKYRVNSFVPPEFVGLDRIYYVERKGIFGWRTVEDIRGKTADEAMNALNRSLAKVKSVEFKPRPE